MRCDLYGEKITTVENSDLEYDDRGDESWTMSISWVVVQNIISICNYIYKTQ